MLFLMLQQHVADSCISQQGMVGVAVYAGKKVQDPLSHPLQIREDLVARRQMHALGFGRVSRSEKTIVSSREGRLSFTLLEDPVGLSHADVPKMPANRTKLAMNLPTKISVVDTGTQAERLLTCLLQLLMDCDNRAHTATCR